jgi:hypothetical protein
MNSEDLDSNDLEKFEIIIPGRNDIRYEVRTKTTSLFVGSVIINITESSVDMKTGISLQIVEREELSEIQIASAKKFLLFAAGAFL